MLTFYKNTVANLNRLPLTKFGIIRVPKIVRDSKRLYSGRGGSVRSY